MPADYVHCDALVDAGGCPYEAKSGLEREVNIALVYTASTTTSDEKDCIFGVAYLSKSLRIPNRMLKGRQLRLVLSSGSQTSHGNAKSLCAVECRRRRRVYLSTTLFVSSRSSSNTEFQILNIAVTWAGETYAVASADSR